MNNFFSTHWDLNFLPQLFSLLLLNLCSYNLSIIGFIAGQSLHFPSYSHSKQASLTCFALIYAITPVIKLISSKIEILIIRKIGSRIVETIIKPVPIPIDILGKIFNNLDFVLLSMFKTMGMKNANDKKKKIKRVVNVRLKNNKTNKIVKPIVG